MPQKFVTNSASQTQKVGEKTVKEFKGRKSATVLGLKGNLGSGKTTFLQGFARGLGVKEKVLSPTFVILKRFKIKDLRFKNFFHIDCYRLKNEKEILELGFKNIIKNPENIVAIEWPEKIKKALPKETIFIDFKFIYPERNRRVDKNKREINFKI